MTEPGATCVLLRHEGVELVLDIEPRGLPCIAYWGADLGALTDDDVLTLVRGGENPVTVNLVDEPVRLAVLPEHWTGWVGRPGLRGSRQGRDWSPKFRVTDILLDGGPITSTETQTAVVHHEGRSTVDIEAVDSSARLALSLTVELTDGGVVRTRATLTNRGEPYQLDDLVLALPVPPVAREILDFAGRWGKERTPQRRELTVGTHLREGRKGRTGPEAATVLHVGAPGFGFATGEVWGVHTGWSGNHTHYAERLSTGEQVIGGGELLLPGEVQLGTGGVVHLAVGLRIVRRRPGRGRSAFPPLPAGPGPASVDRPPGDHQRLGGGLLRP